MSVISCACGDGREEQVQVDYAKQVDVPGLNKRKVALRDYETKFSVKDGVVQTEAWGAKNIMDGRVWEYQDWQDKHFVEFLGAIGEASCDKGAEGEFQRRAGRKWCRRDFQGVAELVHEINMLALDRAFVLMWNPINIL